MADSERADIAWRKSTASQSAGDCVEVSFTEEAVLVRRSQHPLGPRLSFSYSEWAAFLTGARRGEFDVPDMDLYECISAVNSPERSLCLYRG